jgi:hypothetical protein
LFIDRIQRGVGLVLLVLFNLECLFLSQGGNLTSFYPIPFQLLAFTFIQRISDKAPPFKTGLLAGGFSIITILIRPTSIGSYVALFLVLVINNLPKTKEYWLKFALGGFVIVGTIFAVLLLFFAWNNALPDVWNQLYVFNRFYSAAKDSGERLTTVVEGLKLLSQHGLIPLAGIGLGAILWQSLTEKKLTALHQMIILSFVLDWLLVALGGRAKIPYYLANIPSSVLLILFGLSCIQGNSGFRKFISIAAIGYLVFLSVIYVQEFKSSIGIGKNSRQTKGAIVEFIKDHTRESDRIVVWGTESWIYFHTNRLAPIKMIYVNPLYFVGYVTDEMLDNYYLEVMNTQPEMIISTISGGRITSGFGENSTNVSKELSKQLLEKYHPVFSVDEWTVYQLQR